MTWLQRYRLRHFLRFSFWFVPMWWMLAAVFAVRAVRWLDSQTGWAWFEFTAAGARGVLDSLSSSMLTFIVFAVSALLLAVQLASGQLTPRIILHTTVGIGYETPWRQVEAMLRLAAERTPGRLTTPAPFVRHKALSDFCVTYEVTVSAPGVAESPAREPPSCSGRS